MTEKKTATQRHAPKAAAAFTLSGILIASSAVSAAAAIAEDGASEDSSINQTEIDRLGDTFIVSNDYLTVEHTADDEALTDLRVGRAAEWDLSVSLNPEAFSDDNPDAPYSDDAELMTYLTYESDFSGDITVESDHEPSEDVPADVDVQPGLTLAESNQRVGTYGITAGETVDITVSIVPGADLSQNQEIDLMFSILAVGEAVDEPEDPEEEDDEDPWIEIIPLPGEDEDEDDEPITPEPTTEPEETVDPTEEPTDAPEPTEGPEPTDEETTDEPTTGPTTGPTEADGEETEDPSPSDSPEETEPTNPVETEGAMGNDDEQTDAPVQDGDVVDNADNRSGGSGIDQGNDTEGDARDDIVPPVVTGDSDFSGQQRGGDEAGAVDSSIEQGEPVEIATGFFDEFSKNPLSIGLFFTGLFALAGAFFLRKKEIAG